MAIMDIKSIKKYLLRVNLSLSLSLSLSVWSSVSRIPRTSTLTHILTLSRPYLFSRNYTMRQTLYLSLSLSFCEWFYPFPLFLSLSMFLFLLPSLSLHVKPIKLSAGNFYQNEMAESDIQQYSSNSLTRQKTGKSCRLGGKKTLVATKEYKRVKRSENVKRT